MSYAKLSEIWATFDVKERKKFAAHDIIAAISELPKGNSEDWRCHYEVLGFSFVGTNRENEWGTFYGYQFKNVRKDTREVVYWPDIKDVTPDIISYWEMRATEVVNPLLKMHYTGLVLDFKKRITGEQPAYKTIKLACIEALATVVEGDYAEYEYVSLEYAKRALILATGFSNKNLVKRVVKAYFDAHNRYDKKKWGHHIFRTLIKYPQALAEYKEEILKENLDRLNVIEKKVLGEGNKTDTYVLKMVSEVEILCEYYHSIGDDGKIENLLDRLCIAIRRPMPARGGLWGHGMLEQMQKRYRKYGLDNKANQLFGDVTEQGIKAIAEMQRTEFTFTLEREKIDAYLNEMMKGTHEQRIIKYIIEYIPVRALLIKRQKELAKEAPLEDLIPTVLFDSSGNTINRLGFGKNAEELKLHHFIYENWMIESVFMHIHVEELKKNMDVTVETLMAMFDGCPLVTDQNRALLRRGFEAYMNGDHVVCCHILIPQVEAMIRMLVYLNGGVVIHQGEDPAAGTLYISLDSLLNSEVAERVMKEDMITYFKALFVSPTGWNLRNRFCHGLLSAGSFNSDMSDRLVHAMMILSYFKTKEESASSAKKEGHAGKYE